MIRRWRQRQARKVVQYIDWDPEVDTLFLTTESDLSSDEIGVLRQQFYGAINRKERHRVSVVTMGLGFVVLRGVRPGPVAL